MGLIVDIYRWARADCSAGGVSSRCDELTLVNVPGPFSPTEDRPAALLLPGHGGKGTVRIVPAEDNGPGGWIPQGHGMMGGAYAATSDSRFRDAVEALTGAPFYGAVALHDRFE